MTAALQSDVPPEGGWTTDHLDGLPEDGRRRELLDGVLLVPPSPTRFHQTIAMRLGVALELVVHTHRIDPVNEVYTETGRWTKFVDTGEPFPVNLSIARITPRHL